MDVFDLMQEQRERALQKTWLISSLSRLRRCGTQLVHQSPELSRVMWRQYQCTTTPRVPRPLRLSLRTVLSSCVTVRTITEAGGLTQLPHGTQLLLLANCLPFLKRGGFSLQQYGLSPIMVLEHRKALCIFTSALLHLDLDHLLSDLSSMVSCGTYLESRSSTKHFTAAVLSLTAMTNSLYVVQSWIGMKWLGVWRPYHVSNAFGASSLCLALQVVVDHMRGGVVSFVGCNKLQLPTHFSCWPSLVINQLLAPSATLNGPLCGIIAGLLHVHLPGAVRKLNNKIRKQGQQQQQLWTSRGLHDAMREARRMLKGKHQLHHHDDAIRTHKAASTKKDSVEVASKVLPDILVHMAGFGLTILVRKAISPRRKRHKHSSSSTPTQPKSGLLC